MKFLGNTFALAFVLAAGFASRTAVAAGPSSTPPVAAAAPATPATRAQVAVYREMRRTPVTKPITGDMIEATQAVLAPARMAHVTALEKRALAGKRAVAVARSEDDYEGEIAHGLSTARTLRKVAREYEKIGEHRLAAAAYRDVDGAYLGLLAAFHKKAAALGPSAGAATAARVHNALLTSLHFGAKAEVQKRKAEKLTALLPGPLPERSTYAETPAVVTGDQVRARLAAIRGAEAPRPPAVSP